MTTAVPEGSPPAPSPVEDDDNTSEVPPEEEDDDAPEVDDPETRDVTPEPDSPKREAPGTPGWRKMQLKLEKQRALELKKQQKAKLDELLAKQNAEVEKEAAFTNEKRLHYLLEQADIYQHFMMGDSDAVGGAKKGGDKKSGEGRHRRSEKDEDTDMMKAGLGEFTRLTVQPSCVTGKMREYQLEGLNWLIRLYESGINGILADEMGLGKTLQTISLLGFLKQYKGVHGPHLVVTPKSTVGNWINEIKRWCPDLRPIRLLGSQEERLKVINNDMVPNEFDVLVTTYENAIKEKNAIRKFSWRYLIIDEAHRIKNENSVLSRVVRLYNCQNRLLLTGTPLQNNLHELWALLNFLLPDVFKSSEQFDEWFDLGDKSKQHEIITKLHSILRPFLLRRLKTEVERGIPPKTETNLYIGMSAMQTEWYRNILMKDPALLAGGGSKDRVRMLNVLMQLRKCCNHPYLFQGAEPGPPFTNGPHLIENSGKLILLDKLLPKLKERGHRVLLFSQMTRLLDILEDYLLLRGHNYCRLDGSTGGEERDDAIASFNKEDSDKFIFLLSTRAGGLGINLATADTVIIYDSDWNPQMDMQAMDRAHRIGQKKPVQVFRLITENSVEEKVVERALKKLHLDAMVIQQGRLVEQNKGLSKEEVQAMVKFGADKIFRSKDGTLGEEDVDAILERSKDKTAALTSTVQQTNYSLANFSLDTKTGDNLLEEVEGSKKKEDLSFMWLDPGKRERKANNYDVNAYYRDALNTAVPRGPKEPKRPRAPVFHDFQFYNQARLMELFEKECALIEAARGTEQEKPPTLDEDDLAERERLMSEGFSDWNRRDYKAYVKAVEKHGRHDLESVASELEENKTFEQVEAYNKAFWENYENLQDWQKTIEKIEQGESRIKRRKEIEEAIRTKLDREKNPWQNLKIAYGTNKAKTYDEDNDRFLLCMTNELGYGEWDRLKVEIRNARQFRFDWFFKSRTPLELQRRVDTLVRLVEKENADFAESNKKSKKNTPAKDSKKTTPAKRKAEEEKKTAKKAKAK